MQNTSKTDWERLAQMPDEDIDTSDIPELDDNFFQRADIRLPTKQPVTLRVDSDVLAWFKSKGRGYQTRINKLLRQYMNAHRGE